MPILRPLGPGVGPISAAADGPSEVVTVGHASGFWIVATADTWVTVSDDDTPIATMDATNAVLIAGDQLYGPFEFMSGVDLYLHVAGDGATATVVVTLV